MEDTNKLSPCPFCGNQPEKVEIGNSHTQRRAVHIKCRKCNILKVRSILNRSGVMTFERLEELTVKEWNTRYKDQPK